MGVVQVATLKFSVPKLFFSKAIEFVREKKKGKVYKT